MTFLANVDYHFGYNNNRMIITDSVVMMYYSTKSEDFSVSMTTVYSCTIKYLKLKTMCTLADMLISTCQYDSYNYVKWKL